MGEIVQFRPPRTKPRYADGKAVGDFARVYEIINGPPEEIGDHLDELAELMGQKPRGPTGRS